MESYSISKPTLEGYFPPDTKKKEDFVKCKFRTVTQMRRHCVYHVGVGTKSLPLQK